MNAPTPTDAGSGLDAIEIKAFLPARDFSVSRQFYLDLGFSIGWESHDLAQLQIGSSRFLLTRFYQKALAENFMMHLLVPDVDAWWQRVRTQRLADRYGVRADPPEDRAWGLRDFTLTDPSSVLWRIAQTIEAAPGGGDATGER